MAIIELIGNGEDPDYEYRFICIEDDQRRRDLSELLRRGLNTWPNPPEWLLALQDELRGMEKV